MRLALIFTLLFSLPAFGDCINRIAKSQIPAAISGNLVGELKACGPADPCVCFDGLSFDELNWDGENLYVDAARVAAKDAKKAAEAQKEAGAAARKARLKALRTKLEGPGLNDAEKTEALELLLKNQTAELD